MRTIVALLFLLATATIAQAGVDVRIRYGHGQEAVAGAITPLVVEIKSREAEPLGVRIETLPGSTLGAGEVCRAADLLSPGSTKQITLLYRPYARTRPEVVLRFDRSVGVVAEDAPEGRPVREVTLRAPRRPMERGSEAYSRFTVLTVGPGANALPAAPEGLRILPMEEKDLPDVWHAYDGIDAVLLRRPAGARPVEREKILALLRYVEAGGRLVISTNRPERLKEIGLSPFLPADQVVDEFVELTVAQIAVPFAPRDSSAWGAPAPRDEVRVFGLRVRDGATATAAMPDTGIPLVVQHRHGYGTIAMVAFDTACFRTLTSGRALVIHAVLFGGWTAQRAGLDIEAIETTVFPNAGFIIGGDVDDQPVTGILQLLRAGAIRPPPMGLLFLFMLLYIFAVGPLDYWILKKHNLLKWSALTFLGLAVVFSGSAWFVSFHLFAGSGKLNRVTFVDVLPQLENQPDRILLHDFAGHYAPTGARLDLEPVGETTHVADFAEPSAYLGGGGLQRSPVELAFSSSARVTGRLLVPFRSLRTTRTVIARDETFPLDITFEGPHTVKVRNGLPFLLRDVTVIHEGSAAPVGDMEPGAEVEITAGGGRPEYRPIGRLIGSTREAPSREDILATGRRLFRLTWAGAGLSLARTNDAEWAEHFRHLSKMGLDRSPAILSGTSMVVAWTDERDPFGLGGEDTDGFSLTILRKVFIP